MKTPNFPVLSILLEELLYLGWTVECQQTIISDRMMKF